jgi:hypothetical protein
MTLPKVCLLIGTLWLAACAPSGPKGVDPDVLAQAVGDAVGDPGTCVILAERDSGKVLWRSAKPIVCARALPSCVSPARMTVEDLVDKAAKGGALVTGCADVGWAAGPTRRDDVVFAAVMQGERALPGIEVARRLDKAFERAGL